MNETILDAAAQARPVTPLGILAATLARVSARLDETEHAGGVVDEDVRRDVREASLLAGGLDPYVAACSEPESHALRTLARRTAEEDWPGHNAVSDGPALEQEMLSGHVEGRLLAMLVAVTGATRVLEIGMFTGYSALAMAEVLPDDGTLVACEIDPRAADLARRCFAVSPVGERVRVEVGPALETLHRLAAEGASFDLVFVDADKAGYRDYLEVLLDTGLLAPHGLVCVDNTLMQGEPWLDSEPSVNGRAIADFNRWLAADLRCVQVVLPVRDGLTLVRRS